MIGDIDFMVKLFIAFLVIIISAAGCANQQQQPEKGPTISQTRNEPGLPSDEELIRDARNEVIINVENINRKNTYVSQEQAKSLETKHLHLKTSDSTSVNFERYEGDYYLFHVTDLVHFNIQPEHMSRGWYKVNPNTGEVLLYKK
jgi:hypothetical protein